MSSHPNTANKPQRSQPPVKWEEKGNLSEESDAFSEDYCDSRDENGNLVLGKRDRKENGLVTLTHRFIALLKKAPD